MLIVCPKEIKVREYRVGMTPTAVREARARGRAVLVEAAAGVDSGSPTPTTASPAPRSSTPPTSGSSGPT